MSPVTSSIICGLWENAGIDLYEVMAVMEERDHKKGNKKEVGHTNKVF